MHYSLSTNISSILPPFRKVPAGHYSCPSPVLLVDYYNSPHSPHPIPLSCFTIFIIIHSISIPSLADLTTNVLKHKCLKWHGNGWGLHLSAQTTRNQVSSDYCEIRAILVWSHCDSSGKEGIVRENYLL